MNFLKFADVMRSYKHFSFFFSICNIVLLHKNKKSRINS